MTMESDPRAWTAFQEQVIEIPETAESLDIGKQARQVEEVVIHPVVEEYAASIRDHVRHTEIDIQRGAAPLIKEAVGKVPTPARGKGAGETGQAGRRGDDLCAQFWPSPDRTHPMMPIQKESKTRLSFRRFRCVGFQASGAAQCIPLSIPFSGSG